MSAELPAGGPPTTAAAIGGYAGDIDARQAWDLLAEQPSAVLIDVRTRPEWEFVGVPDLSSLGKTASFVPWKVYPEMVVNQTFVDDVAAVVASNDAPVLFICRSGQRSRDAAIAMTAAGYSRCYNVAGGFEGPMDPERHRGGVDGWKATQLPWVQS